MLGKFILHLLHIHMHALMNLNPQLYHFNLAQYIERCLLAKFLVKQKRHTFTNSWGFKPQFKNLMKKLPYKSRIHCDCPSKNLN
jgi:hypothetical protein